MNWFTTTVIALSLTDTWPGILEKLSQAPGRRVVFVVPRRHQVLRSAPRLRALRTAALDQGKRVALVTHDPAVVAAARMAGLPTFGSVWRARWFPWWYIPARRRSHRPLAPALVYAAAHAVVPLPRRGSLPRPPRPRAGSALHVSTSWLGWFHAFLVLVLVGGIITLAAGTILLLAPWASVWITPAPERVQVALNFTAHPGVEEPELGLRVVPARYIEALVEDTVYAPATGRRLSPSERATGTVIFTNRVDQEVRIPPNTRVRTATAQAIEFRTTEEAVLPPRRGARVEVPIEAVEPGPSGNVRAFTISQVVGPLALQVAVTNPEPTTGGGVKEVPVVTARDKDVARREALRLLTQRAIEELTRKQRQGEFIPRQTIQTFVMAETYDRFAGEEAENVGVRLRLLVRALAVDGSAARELALRALRQSLPPAGRLVRDSTQVEVGPVTAWDPTTQTVYFAVRAQGTYVLDINEDEVRSAIAGKPVEEAAVILQTRWRLASPPAFYLGPDWLIRQEWIPSAWRERMPVQPGRILVTVDLEGALREGEP